MALAFNGLWKGIDFQFGAGKKYTLQYQLVFSGNAHDRIVINGGG